MNDEQVLNFINQAGKHVKEGNTNIEHAIDMVYRAIQVAKEERQIAFLFYARDFLLDMQNNITAFQDTLQEAVREFKPNTEKP